MSHEFARRQVEAGGRLGTPEYTNRNYTQEIVLEAHSTFQGTAAVEINRHRNRRDLSLIGAAAAIAGGSIPGVIDVINNSGVTTRDRAIFGVGIALTTVFTAVSQYARNRVHALQDLRIADDKAFDAFSQLQTHER